ncbi:MAG: monofunctional biosynthetic peptidoglycan transglycosylase [Nevskiaceae bacterium]|nr:MAG: monofunctional biosynthetic peptidoglycan transglycosylase [Nevskiaceae bacterium]TBR73166.1 MAG: monofunctional biosynthetic peptidoglycan transglycosylase [Nevskiaceae bacterium]
MLAWAAGAWLAATISPVLVFRVMPVPTSAYMLEQRIAWLRAGEPHPPLRQHWVPLERISPQLQLAVIASEDQKFPYHHGFDVDAIRDALRYNARHRKTRGASTISQQTARNLFLWPARTWVRKGLEVYFTVLLETLWPKQRILAVYLNIAQFGDGIYGAEAAARAWFDTSAAALTAQQAAQLAAVLPAPKRLHAGQPSAYVLERAAAIREQMANLGPGYLPPTSLHY